MRCVRYLVLLLRRWIESPLCEIAGPDHTHNDGAHKSGTNKSGTNKSGTNKSGTNKVPCRVRDVMNITDAGRSVRGLSERSR